MKKIVLLGVLFSFLCVSCFSENQKKESERVKALLEKVNLRLDSIIQNQPYEIIHGDKYYRFREGVFTVTSDTIIIGAFGILDRIRFTSRNGQITFTGIDEKRKPLERNLEQMLFYMDNY